ncbi:nitrate- and nitrite sensing domain-containing protein [Actinomadura flavalba]|uniref:sensor histidine kinase n=1 Tax=Actinomadura flavalba TaxID=1120938 RepID=UPI000367A715|nr:nitrate- and nitrite sensing domain-containing protein [Actinomadura flavalba]
MRFRNSRLRTKVTALLLSLIALWAFAAWVTLREGVNLLGVSSLDQSIAQPTDPLLAELQTERRLSVRFLAVPGTPDRRNLDAQRRTTDRAAATVAKLARDGNVGRFASDDLKRRVNEMLGQLRGLPTLRDDIDNRRADRNRAAGQYSGIIESIFRSYDELATLDDKDFATDTRTSIELNRMWEVLSQEDAIITGALAAGHMTATEHVEFTQTVGVRRVNTERALSAFQPSDAVVHERLTASARLAQVRKLEDRVMQSRRVFQSRAGRPAALTAAEWDRTVPPALAEMRTEIQAAGDRLVERATPIATGVLIRLALAGGLGLLAVIASIVVSITTARALVRQLERLRAAAWELADRRLPDVVDRLGHGEKVDVAAEAPPLRFGNDEIGQVGQAFNAVQETAIRTAVEQAELRRGIRDVLLSLARRTQTLVHRQLSMLDTMERRRDIDPKELDELFRLDHLATRMRRNAENLIVLSGAIPARGWRRSVPMVDVVRAAVGEVEDYTRVSVLPFGDVELAGRAVGDLTHLLAELIENAVSFSPPDTVVQIGGHLVASGFAIDIEDRGLGMTDEKLAEINERIADPPEFNLQSSVQLGLFVVGKLAERYGVQVQLKRSAYGGTTAVIVIPQELVVDDPDRDRGSSGPVPVAAGTTTRNGLAVRQPTAVGVGAAPPQAEAPRQRSLVALPPPPRDEPAPPAYRPDQPPREQSPGPAATPETHEAEAPSPVSDPTTPSGLPVRVPQASLAPALRTEEPLSAETAEEEPDESVRSPEEIQRIMGAYQRGTRRGRSDAAAGPSGAHPTEGEDE